MNRNIYIKNIYPKNYVRNNLGSPQPATTKDINVLESWKEWLVELIQYYHLPDERLYLARLMVTSIENPLSIKKYPFPLI